LKKWELWKWNSKSKREVMWGVGNEKGEFFGGRKEPKNSGKQMNAITAQIDCDSMKAVGKRHWDFFLVQESCG